MTKEAVIFDGVEKYFGSLCALKSISFAVPQNTITGLIGANGSGKTTTIKCLLNYYDDYSGKITVLGADAKTISQDKNIISYIPDQPVYYEELTVIEHLQFISSIYDTKNKVDEIIKDFELESHLQKFPHELSKGTLQKLLISCALLRKFDLLVADEPFQGLDPKQIYKLREKIAELRKGGKTIILSTHLLKLIEKICDYKELLISKSKEGLYLPYSKASIIKSFVVLGIPIQIIEAFFVGIILSRPLLIILLATLLYTGLLIISMYIEKDRKVGARTLVLNALILAATYILVG